ncbi:MAG: UDP-N-acetylmuramoyl-L-alanyl-D-glutamate--2,6-diaminopimelate ligase [Candidatus Parcubacteria bacterium]|nr:UDP-N-acetylmuramoyl-L-alanyl-D-glutamate--2,6-diaminopimelate ligase [Candidatus Parcubacteria bacterium]
MIKKIIKKFIPKFVLNWYYQFFPLLGAILYRFPSKNIIVVGITGTNGKSTTVQLMTDILKQANISVASMSSVRFQVKDDIRKNKLKMTMPGRFKLQKFLRQAVNSGCQYAILEVTSEGIKQFRHKFINFKTVIFTNLEKEHIESHGSFENYKQAKKKLFQVPGIKTSIINLDDSYADYFLDSPNKEKWGYQLKPKTQNPKPKKKEQIINIVEGEDVKLFDDHSEFIVKEQKFNIPLVGEFNVYNSLAAICFGLSQGINLNIIAEALEKTEGVSGRMEFVIKEPFRVVVDYAHTPRALENVYKTLSITKSQNNAKKLICVLGSCGGGRDKWKRPVFGSLASQYCDEIILTNEDPYDEDPIKIIEQVAGGISKEITYKKIFDRREAIRTALNIASSGDTVAITGKGAEPWICVAGGKKIPWDDRQVVREESPKV